LCNDAAFRRADDFHFMRACFLGQNVFALGFGVATLQSPPLVRDEPAAQPGEKPAQKPLPPAKPRPLRTLGSSSGFVHIGKPV
jgi:hypothetical protein